MKSREIFILIRDSIRGVPRVPGNLSISKKAEWNSPNLGKIPHIFKNSITCIRACIKSSKLLSFKKKIGKKFKYLTIWNFHFSQGKLWQIEVFVSKSNSVSFYFHLIIVYVRHKLKFTVRSWFFQPRSKVP